MKKFKVWFGIIGLCVGVFVGVLIQPLISGDNVYEQLGKFRDVLLTVEKNYVDEVKTSKLVEGAIAGMLNDLDPHSVYIPAEQQKKVEEDFKGSFQGIGVEFDIVRDTITIISPISGGPSEALGIQSGDKIVKIDGKNAIGMQREDVPKKLRGPKGTHVSVSVIRSGLTEPLIYDITRADIPLVTVDASFVNPDGTAYMTVNRFAEPTYEEFMRNMDKLSAQGMNRLILDLRGNPGGYMDRALMMLDEFISGDKILLSTKSVRKDAQETYKSNYGQAYEKLPIIVLINAGSASASEIISGTIQDLDRGLIVGETSFGKGLVQRQFPLSDGSAFRVTTARYYTPSGRLIQRSYKDGKEDYYMMKNRQSDEEGDNIEHSHDKQDTSRPVYKTASGRKVLGGGGVTPDYVVKLDTLTPFAIDVIRKNLIWEFTESFINSTQGKELKNKYQNNFNDFLNNFKISENMMGKFLEMAKAKKIEVKQDQLNADKEDLENRIKSRIARSIWGNTAFYQVALQGDKQYIKALSLFPESMKIAKLVQK